jgi:hypothetical protein
MMKGALAESLAPPFVRRHQITQRHAPLEPQMPRKLLKLVAIALSLGMAGCAVSHPGETSALVTPTAATPGTEVATTGYVLSAKEQELGCKQLTGRMQIRILEIRDYTERNRTTLAARALQTGTTAVFGGSQTGVDPDGTYDQDRAMLEAYNQQLLAKGCRTYDLESELTPQDVRVTPKASIKPVNAK